MKGLIDFLAETPCPKFFRQFGCKTIAEAIYFNPVLIATLLYVLTRNYMSAIILTAFFFSLYSLVFILCRKEKTSLFFIEQTAILFFAVTGFLLILQIFGH